MSTDSDKKPDNWERDTLEKVALAAVGEQRQARRWGIFFKSLTFLYLFALLFLFQARMSGVEGGSSDKSAQPHTALIEINGVISADSEASADKLVTGLRNAFESENVKGVILRINSPGGSPVQSSYVYNEIMRLRKEKPELPVYAVVSDVCASGGYYIASAAEKIYVNPSSIVGSIGVLMNGFGFTDAMEKLGVERRLLTAGENKGMLDPFSPLREQDLAHIKTILNNLHQHFIKSVKEGRGERLKDDPTLFTGMYWSGEQAVELGLADEFGSSSEVAREVFKAKDIVVYNPHKNLLERFSDRLGTSISQGISQSLSSFQLQ